MHTGADGVKRRDFLRTAGAAAGLLIVPARTAFGTEANSRLELGIIGCGARGPWIGAFFQEHTNTKVTALHDYFADRVQEAGDRLDVPASRRYIGLDGYHELLADGVDAVAIESPPYFHPEQTVAAVEQGVHVFLAKPVAVDVPGCTALLEASRKASGKLSILVDFQTRNDPFYREAAARVHAGDIGAPATAQAYYYAQRLNIRAEPGTESARLRNWMFDIALSGDIIVEQNIHVIDVTNWLLDGRPDKAWGAGGRRVRTDVGDAWDHFMVTYTYPNDVLVDFSSAQFTTGFDALCVRVYGATGTCETHYGGDVTIRSRAGTWPGGSTARIYSEGALNNVKDFHAAILNGDPVNNLEESVDSTLASILGRTAAYKNENVTWDEMIEANERLDPALDLPDDGPFQTW